MNLGTELRRVLDKHIKADPYLPEELKSLVREATIPMLNHVCAVIGDIELACRRTKDHPEIWDGVGKKRKPYKREANK